MNRSQRATPISRRVSLSNTGDTRVRMFHSYRFLVVRDIRPSMSMSASQYSTRSLNRLSGVSVVSADCSSDRSTSLAFNARSAALAVAPEHCTWRLWPSQSWYRVRATYRPVGDMRVLMSPKMPMLNRCRAISAHRRSVRLESLLGSRCWAIQARTSEIANFRCLPNR